MKNKMVHVTPANAQGGWNVKKGDAQQASVNTALKADAVRMGRIISQRSGFELVIHGRDGRIERSDSQGHDPCPLKHKK